MGRWGGGNFEDDLARDYLGEVIAMHEEFIERLFAGDMPEKLAKMNFFDAGAGYLVPTVDIILKLHQSLKGDYLPKPATVSRWRRDYVARVDALLPETLPDAGSREWFQGERRPVIETTFSKLLEC